MPKRKCKRTVPFRLYDPDTVNNPFMLVDSETRINHAIMPGLQLRTYCGIYSDESLGRVGRIKYKQKPSTEMNCLVCIAESTT